MPLTLPERVRLRKLVLAQHRDWAAVHSALKARNLAISQSSLDRFFSGRSDSPRTMRTLAALLGTSPEALENQVRIVLPATNPSQTQSGKKPATTLRNPEAFRIAYQLWVEMTTRKLGLPIDPTQDLVSELYDSWYAFFKSARELTKAIPLHKDPRSPELRRLVQLSHSVLNDGLRPHLQRWQARYRRWLTNGGDPAQAPGLSPQEAQQLFPQWTALRDDLLATNRRLMGYLAALDVMVARPNAPLSARVTRKS